MTLFAFDIVYQLNSFKNEFQKKLVMLRSEIASGMCAMLRTVAASNNRDHPMRSLYYCLFAPHTYIFFSLRTSRLWWITQSTQHHRRGCNNIPSFFQQTTPIAHSLCESWTPHDLHILGTAPFCCDRKSRAACAQSFAPWQQATIEITRRDHSIIACSCHIHIFLFFAHIPFVVNHTINATPPEWLQQLYGPPTKNVAHPCFSVMLSINMPKLC